jgi:hypothetical protein
MEHKTIVKESNQHLKATHQLQKSSGVYLEDNRNEVVQRKPEVVQRITEEDMAQATIVILGSAEKHGYSADGLRSIIRHRFSEIKQGRQQHLLIGKGADEGTSYYGSIIYDCTLQANGTFYIEAFHAHGGQTEPGSAKGY